MLKEFRNKVVSNRPAQSAIRRASRLGVLPATVYRRLPPLGAHPVTSPGGHEFTYVADITDMMARGVVWENLKAWEAGSLRAFSELARKSNLFLDVGAYSGVYSLIACIDGPGDAIAFEPNPSIRPLLVKNVVANHLQDRISIIPLGVSDRPGEAHLTVPFDTTATRVDEHGTGPLVQLTTIDETVGDRRVDLIKIDVEGLEPRVLQGGRRTLQEHHPALIIECLTNAAFEDVLQALRPFGYSCAHLRPGGAPLPTSRWVNLPGHANFLWTVASD